MNSCMMSRCGHDCKDHTVILWNVGACNCRRVYSFCNECIAFELNRRFYIKLKARDEYTL